ncbi:MAG: P1 family peptidase, partial [Clostridia bacterium]|nr:P1 family peptidase [Clostridia bacterium]
VKGGLGSASQRLPGGAPVGALAVVNSLGEVRDPATGRVLAGPRGDDGGFVDSVRALTEAGLRPDGPAAAGNTTLVVVATDAVLDRRGVERMAVMAHDGLARAVRPAHTAYDGDVAFALATGRAGVAVEASVLGAVAADLVAAAICTAVLHAQPLCGIPAACGRGLPPSGGEE